MREEFRQSDPITVALAAKPLSELAAVIQGTHAALVRLQAGHVTKTDAPVFERKSQVEISKSIGIDRIVSFIDGRSYKVLKRHLTSHNLDPRRYRERFGLPPDYPMVASSYAERRSELAKAIGLGRPGGSVERATENRQVV